MLCSISFTIFIFSSFFLLLRDFLTLSGKLCQCLRYDDITIFLENSISWLADSRGSTWSGDFPKTMIYPTFDPMGISRARKLKMNAPKTSKNIHGNNVSIDKNCWTRWGSVLATGKIKSKARRWMRYCITNSLEIKANFVLQFVLQGPAGYIFFPLYFLQVKF